MDRPVSRGALLLGLEPWVRVTTDADFRILEGGLTLAQVLPCPAAASLDGCFDPAGARFFREVAVSADPEIPRTRYLTTSSGRPIELVLYRDGDRWHALLRTAENRLQRMDDLVFFYRTFLTGPGAVAFTDPEGTILDVNRAFLDLYGYKLHEVVGQNPRILKSGRQSPAAYEAMWRSLKDPSLGHWSGEILNRRKDGAEVSVVLNISSVRDRGGQVVGFVAHAIDITKRRQMEQELEAKNRELETLNQLKSDLVAITSHDLKSPLNAVINYIHLLRDSVGEMPAEALQATMDKMLSAALKMSSFIHSILDIEKINSGGYALETRRIRLDSVLRSCVETSQVVAQPRGITIRFAVEGAPGPVVADPVKMEQVFNNLLSNAVKFSPLGCEMEVRYEARSPERHTMVIEDRGPGIPPEDLERIFDRYYQVERREQTAQRAFGSGTGLGLTIARTIVEMHGGAIRAENRQGGGCRFIVQIPTRLAPSSGRDLAALVLDPDGGVVPVIEAAFRKREVSWYAAKNAAEMQRIIEFERPDLVFARAGETIRPQDVADLLLSWDGPRPTLVFLAREGEEAFLPAGTRHLSLPLLEVEVMEVLQDLLLNRGRALT